MKASQLIALLHNITVEYGDHEILVTGDGDRFTQIGAVIFLGAHNEKKSAVCIMDHKTGDRLRDDISTHPNFKMDSVDFQ